MKKLIQTVSLLLIAGSAFAQDGNAGINEATTQVKSYFATGTNLMYAIGAIVGLVAQSKFIKNGTTVNMILVKLLPVGSAPAFSW